MYARERELVMYNKSSNEIIYEAEMNVLLHICTKSRCDQVTNCIFVWYKVPMESETR